MTSNDAISSEKLAQDIIDACTTGNHHQLRDLIPQYHERTGPSLPDPDYLLQVAAKNGNVETMRLFFDSLPPGTRRKSCPWDPEISHGMYLDPDVPKEWNIGENGIIFAALEGRDPVSVFRLFHEYGMEPDYNLDRAGNTTAVAIGRGDVTLVRFFFSQGAKSTGYRLHMRESYLGTAATKPDPSMLNLLIEHGSRLEGSRALGHAVESGRIENAKILIGLGADINEAYTIYDYMMKKEKNYGRPLHWAIIGREFFRLTEQEKPASKAETVRFLLSQGANPEVYDEEGKTPFQLAIEKGEDDVVRVFKEYGVDK